MLIASTQDLQEMLAQSLLDVNLGIRFGILRNRYPHAFQRLSNDRVSKIRVPLQVCRARALVPSIYIIGHAGNDPLQGILVPPAPQHPLRKEPVLLCRVGRRQGT